MAKKDLDRNFVRPYKGVQPHARGRVSNGDYLSPRCGASRQRVVKKLG